jgi:hypothetical protein
VMSMIVQDFAPCSLGLDPRGLDLLLLNLD